MTINNGTTAAPIFTFGDKVQRASQGDEDDFGVIMGVYLADDNTAIYVVAWNTTTELTRHPNGADLALLTDTVKNSPIGEKRSARTLPSNDDIIAMLADIADSILVAQEKANHCEAAFLGAQSRDEQIRLKAAFGEAQASLDYLIDTQDNYQAIAALRIAEPAESAYEFRVMSHGLSTEMAEKLADTVKGWGAKCYRPVITSELFTLFQRNARPVSEGQE